MNMRSPALAFYPPDNHLEGFFIDQYGALQVVWKVQNGPWQGPVGLTAQGFAPPEAPVAAAFYDAHGQLEVFTIDAFGALNVVWKVQNENWQGPVGLTDRGLLVPGGGVAAASYAPYDQLEVFTVDKDGVLRVVWKRANEPWAWNGAGLTAPEFAPGARLSAVYYPPEEQLEVFTIDRGGAVRGISKAHNEPWRVPVTLPGAAPAGAPLAAVYYPPHEQLVVCFVDTIGATRCAWMEQNGRWQGPSILSLPNHTTPGGGIAAAHYPLNDNLEVFVVDGDGAVTVTWRASGGNWNPPAAITIPAFATPGAPLAVANYPLQHQLELVTTSSWHRLSLLWKVENSFWSPCPVPLEDPPARSPEAAAPEPIEWLGTSRIGQLTGSKDPQGLPLLNPWDSWGATGVDLGANTEHSDGTTSRLFIFFGDVPRAGRDEGPEQDADLVAWTEDSGLVPGGFHIQPVMQAWYFDPFMVQDPIGVLGTDETPTGAFSYGGRAYVFIFVKKDRDAAHPGIHSYLVSKADPRTPGPYREEFRFAPNRFWQVAPVVVRNADHPWLPSTNGDGLVLFGHGANPDAQTDAVHLAWMPLNGDAGPIKEEARYFAGPNVPWSPCMDRAAPLIRLRPHYTSVSAAWLAESGLWIVLYSKAFATAAPMGSVVARIGPTPLALSDEVEVFNPCREQAFGRYMHWPGFDNIHRDIPPAIGDDPGWAYGAFLLRRFTKWHGEHRQLDLCYLLSLSRPYQVQVMLTTLQMR
ncbi:MAG: hypothetical protein ACREOQ_12660 [Gemmatimonadales bacterium]